MSATAVRYPVRAIEFARRLYEEQGKTISEVREALRKRGFTPAKTTVIHWCIPEVRDSHNAKSRTGIYPSCRGRGPRTRRKPAWMAIREQMRHWRSLSLPFTAVASLTNDAFNLELSAEHTRGILNDTLHPTTIKKLLSGQPTGRGRVSE